MPPAGNQPHGVVQEWPIGLTRSLPTAHWLVVHAFPRQDKRLIENLRNLNLPGCAFFERRIRIYPGKGRQESLIPLLGGYVFVAADRATKDVIYQTGRVVRIIDVPQPAQLALDLASLCALVAVATTPLIVCPTLVPGKRITITQGTFSGCSGVIVKRQNKVDLIVNLELLGHSVSVALPAQFAELVT